MIAVESDHKPTLQIYINQELMLDDTLAWNRCNIQPTVNTEITSIVVTNKGEHSFSANNVLIKPNSSEEICNK